MNSQFFPPHFRSELVRKPISPDRRSVGTAAWLLAAVLGCVFGISRLLASNSLFTDFPVYEPSTNVLKASMVTNASQRVAVASSAPGGSNSVANTTTNGMEALDDQYRLAIGDRLSFQITEDEDDPKLLVVMDSGDLEVPYLGRYPVVGKTCKQLALELKVALEKEYYYRATVIISVDLKAKSRGKVYLVGAVRVPGPQDIPNDEVFSLSKAVMRAGGFTDYADQRNVQITRQGGGAGGGDQTFTENVAKVIQEGRIDADLKLEPGDLIYVPERLVHF